MPLKHDNASQRQRGLALTELMVSLLIGLIVMGALLDTYLGITAAGRDALNAAKLNLELRGAIDTMTDDIRRAGGMGAPPSGTPNPFMNRASIATFSDLNIGTFNTAGDCIEFSYDANSNGLLDADTEFFGFRIHNQAVQIRTGGSGGMANCSTGNWADLTDPTVVQVGLPTGAASHFATSYQCMNSRTNAAATGQCIAGNSVFDAAEVGAAVDLLEKRAVTVNLAGTLQNAPEMSLAFLNEVVTLRNHRIVTVGTS